MLAYYTFCCGFHGRASLNFFYVFLCVIVSPSYYCVSLVWKSIAGSDLRQEWEKHVNKKLTCAFASAFYFPRSPLMDVLSYDRFLQQVLGLYNACALQKRVNYDICLKGKMYCFLFLCIYHLNNECCVWIALKTPPAFAEQRKQLEMAKVRCLASYTRRNTSFVYTVCVCVLLQIA